MKDKKNIGIQKVRKQENVIQTHCQKKVNIVIIKSLHNLLQINIYQLKTFIFLSLHSFFTRNSLLCK